MIKIAYNSLVFIFTNFWLNIFADGIRPTASKVSTSRCSLSNETGTISCKKMIYFLTHTTKTCTHMHAHACTCARKHTHSSILYSTWQARMSDLKFSFRSLESPHCTSTSVTTTHNTVDPQCYASYSVPRTLSWSAMTDGRFLNSCNVKHMYCSVLYTLINSKTHMHMHTHTLTCVHTHVQTHTYTHACTYTCTHTHTQSHTHTRTHTHHVCNYSLDVITY